MVKLSEILEAIAFKELALVDLPGSGSNQHEINGIAALKRLFAGKEIKKGKITWHMISRAGNAREAGTYSFYDTRRKTAIRTGRSEWRMYYSGDFLRKASPGDCLLILKTKTDEIHGVVISKESPFFAVVANVFYITDFKKACELVDEKLFKQDVDYLSTTILSECGVEIQGSLSDLTIVTNAFGEKFPSTAEMSKLARDNAAFDAADLDATLMGWLLREEQLFYAMEKQIIEKKINPGFASAEEFIRFSLSVQNRRKSRRGNSLENHIEEIFKRKNIRYEKNAVTERGNKPDFVFPSGEKYAISMAGSPDITVLAAKSTVKERWRQILKEADKVPEKNLCTIDPEISGNQLVQMFEEKVQLVIPLEIQSAYNKGYQAKMISFSEFVSRVQKL